MVSGNGSGSELVTWLGDEEFRLARLLEQHTLVVQANLGEDEVRRAQQFYGRHAAGLLRIGYTPTEIVEKYPALTLTILVGHAGLAYDQGRYWEEFWDQLGIRANPKFEQALRINLGRLLRRFRLAQFPELSRDYIRQMAIHAAVPVRCLPDLVRVIDRHIMEGRERSAAALVQWLTEPGKPHRMDELDVPVRNFIGYGGDFAHDVLDRIMDFAGHVLEHPDTWDEIDLDTSTTGLPSILLDALIEELRNHPIGAERVRNHEPRRRTPRLIYAIGAAEIRLELPFPAAGDAEPWRISLDGDTREVWPEPGWGVDDGAHPPTVVPIPSPVREAVVEHRPSAVAVAVPVIDARDPLLLFTTDGRRISGTAALPHQVIAVYPGTAALHDPIGGARLEPVAAPTEPVGWTGWRVAQFDLAGHPSVQLVRGELRPGVLRGVRVPAKAEIELPDPLIGVRTLRGHRVYARRPSVVLPADPHGRTTDWRVLVRPAGATRWWIDETWTGEPAETELDPFDGREPGLLGLFEIAVAGPYGRGLRQTVFLAEGLEVGFDREFRIPVAGGLMPVGVTVAVDPPLIADRASFEIGRGDRTRPVEISSADHRFRLLVDPPAVEVRVTPAGQPAQWRTTAATLRPKELESHGVLAIRIPGRVRVRFAAMAGDRVVHTVDPDILADNVFQVSTGAFVDCVREVGDCRIVASAMANDGKVVWITIAVVQAERLCRSIEIDGGDLVFDGLSEQDELAVHLWATAAPWLAVRTLPLGARSSRAGSLAAVRVPLPAELVGAGPLIAQVVVDDPWVSVAAPREPGPAAVRLAQDGWLTDPDAEREALSRFIAGAGPAPDTDDPRAALESLGDSLLPVSEMASLLIRTGLVRRSYAADSTLNDLHPNPWVGCMVEMADLPSLFERRDRVAQERAETIDYLTGKGGELLIEILRVGKARELDQGVFNRQAEVMDRMPAAQVASIVAETRLVPGAYLDLDTRVSANWEAFDARAEWTGSGWSREFAGATLRWLSTIKHTDRALHDVIAARNDALDGVDTVAHPWMLISLQSLTLAMLARMGAHGLVRYPRVIPELTEPWARMAELAPRLVLTDLLIAEALVIHAQHGDLIGDDR